MATSSGLGRYFHAFFDTHFGLFSLVWKERAGGLSVQQIYLPGERNTLEQSIFSLFPESKAGRHPHILSLCVDIQNFLEGKEVSFRLEMLELDRCPSFQRKVLLAEFSVPRGWVTTYGRIAHWIGVPRGARAAGNALARNPFPIVIPCHRAIQADGSLGGYQGGLNMKRALLEQEGVEFVPGGNRVIMNRVHF